MTASTFTSSHVASGVQAKNVHAGVNSVTANYSFSTTMTVNDVVQMVKIPSGAVVVDVISFYTAVAGSNVAFGIGDGDSTNRYTTSQSATGVIRAMAGIPYSYSQDDTIDVKVTGQTSACSGGTITLTVLYKMDDPITIN